VLDGD
jgi:hypothetical protein